MGCNPYVIYQFRTILNNKQKGDCLMVYGIVELEQPEVIYN